MIVKLALNLFNFFKNINILYTSIYIFFKFIIIWLNGKKINIFIVFVSKAINHIPTFEIFIHLFFQVKKKLTPIQPTIYIYTTSVVYSLLVIRFVYIFFMFIN